MVPLQNQTACERTTFAFSSLTNRRLADRYKAIELLDCGSTEIDKPVLRSLILSALERDYFVGKEDIEDDANIADTRSWLLSALGRVSLGDDRSTQTLTSHVIDHRGSKNRWNRYWALEGLIVGANDRTGEIAKQLAGRSDEEPLVSMLAIAYLAANGDRQCQTLMRQKFDEETIEWPVLRALRIVYLPFTVTKLSELVEESEYTDETYDAIVALGKIPSSSPHVDRAARALSAAINKMRRSPWMDGMRTIALTGLGALRVENTGPLILEELVDDNPAIVRQAARSIERILGLRATVIRVVEAAVRSGSASTIEAFARALRWMDRNSVAEELEEHMTSGSVDQQEVARVLLSELGGAVAYEKLRARTAAMKQYNDVLERAEDKVRELFERSIHEARKGFHLATWMDVIVFGAGMLLILASASISLLQPTEFSLWAGAGSGAVGVLGVLHGLLIAKPRQQVRAAVDHLMKIKIVFLAYLRRLHQTDQAYTRLLLENEKITAEQLKAYSDIIGSIMEGATKELAAT
jgi:hypothetical protein